MNLTPNKLDGGDHGGRGSHQGNIAAERFHASRSGLTLRSAWMAKHGDPLPGGVNLEYL